MKYQTEFIFAENDSEIEQARGSNR